jgi:2,3-bisphosphoglycerate-dependent phosphoglycerate mutase
LEIGFEILLCAVELLLDRKGEKRMRAQSLIRDRLKKVTVIDVARTNLRFIVMILVVLVFVAFPGWAGESETTTLILVRHAEENRLLGEIPLSDQGASRARELVRVLSNVKLDAIFSTNTVRSKSTAGPIAEAKKLSVSLYDYKEKLELVPFVDSLLWNYKGKTVLVVGHSDDVPTSVSILRKEYSAGKEVKPINKFVYDNLFIVFVPASGEATVLELKYGQPTPAK